jgi:hypothetical protein
MKNLPVNSTAFIWTPAGPKIVRTDACGEMIGLSSIRAARRAGAKALPESLLGLLAAQAPDAGAQPGGAA